MMQGLLLKMGMPFSVAAHVCGSEAFIAGGAFANAVPPSLTPTGYSAAQAGAMDVMAWQGPSASRSLFAQSRMPRADVLRDADGFYDLEGFVGLVSAGQRADSSDEHRVGMGRFYAGLLDGDVSAGLAGELDARGVPVSSMRVDSDIHQTHDERRSAVELVSNALDAGPGDVDVQLRDGSLVVADSGVGMSPEAIITRLLIPKLSGKPDVAKQIGRFGIGFYTAFRHLKEAGDRVIVETKTSGGTAHRLTFMRRDERIRFKPEALSVSGIVDSGTRVTIRSADIDRKAMTDEMHRYLRYVNPDRRLIVNGRQFNAVRPTELRTYGYGEGGEARLLTNPDGRAGSLVVKAGHLIIEQYDSGVQSSEPETIIELPYSIPLSITRDAVGMDDDLAGLMWRLADETDPSMLVEFFKRLDERSGDKYGFTAMLHERAKEQTDESMRRNPGLRVYPDTPAMRENINAGANVAFVHPALYHSAWFDRFERPREFRGGYSIEDSGVSVPLALVLSDDVTGAYFYDRKSAVIYLNRDYYRQSAPFVLSSLFMVDNLRFHVSWGGVEAAFDVFDGGRDSGANPQTSTGDGDKPKAAVERPTAARPEAPEGAAKKPKEGNAVVESLKAHGLKLTDFGRRLKGLTFDFGDGCSWGIKVRDISTGKLGFVRADGRLILPARYDDITIDGTGDEFYLRAELNGRRGLFDRNGREILPVKYNLMGRVCFSGGRTHVQAKDADGTVNLYDMEGKPLLRKGLMGIDILSRFESMAIAFKDGGGKWGVMDLDDREIIPARYDHINIEWECGAGLSVFLRGEDGSILEGLVSMDGREIIPPKYRSISYTIAGGKDYARVRCENMKFGLLDLEGHEILPAVYDELFIDDDRVAVCQNGGWGLYDIGGKMILPTCHEDIGRMAAGDRRYVEVKQNGRWGLYDRDGRNVLPADYDEIKSLGGYMYVLKGKLWGLLDMDCNTILPIKNAEIDVLNFGDRIYFNVRMGDTRGIVDKDGNVILPFQYDKIVHETRGDRHYLIVGLGESFGLLDENFRELFPMRYSCISLINETVYAGERVREEHADGSGWASHYEAALYTLDGRKIVGDVETVDNADKASRRSPMIVSQRKTCLYGLYDAKGNEILPHEFDLIEGCDYGPYVKARKNGRYGIYDMNGSEISPMAWDGANTIGSGSAGPSIAVRDRSGVVVIPFSMIERIMGSDALRGRLSELRKRRIAVGENVAAIANASVLAWRVIMDDRRKLHLLSHLADPVKDAYVCRHPEADAKTLDRAFALIDEFRRFASSDAGIFIDKIDALMGSTIDMGKVVKDMRAGRRTVDVEAIGIYLGSRGAQFLEGGRLNIQPADGKFNRLSDVVTALRLTRSAGIETMADVRRYSNEEDWRQVNHAIHNIYSLDPYAYIRELMQNSLDVQDVPGRVATEDRRIEFGAMRVDGRLVVRMRDFGGMTEEEFVGLVKPGDGTKADSSGALGGFGVGFYAALADANWLRLRTAVRGSKEVIVADFRVIRDKGGRIRDIEIGVRRTRNWGGFYGTEIETERFAQIPELEVARIEARFRDISQYVSKHRASVSYNGDVVNGGRNGPLAVADGKTIGRVELYDGLEERLLLGGLPVSALPRELLDSVPDVVRRFFERHGFYVNLDHRIVRPTPTRDRLRDHEAVMAELADVLPALLIRGFLERVADSRYAEDLRGLPDMYFVEFYNMAGRSLFDASIRRDADAINEGRLGDFDAARYAKKGGEHDILKLLTLIRFIPVSAPSPSPLPQGERVRERVSSDTKVSLRDIRRAFERSVKGDKDAAALVKACRNSPYLPASVREKLVVATEHHTFAEKAKGLLDSWIQNASAGDADGGYRRERKYGLGEVKSIEHRIYLSLLQSIAQPAYRRHGGLFVRAGLHTVEKVITSYSLHYAQLGVYHIYRSLGPPLDGDSYLLYDILTMRDESLSRAMFERYLAELYEQATHELTHVVAEHRDDMTHAPKFYDDQMAMMAETVIAPGEADRLFEKYRAMAMEQIEVEPEEISETSAAGN